MSYNLQLFDQAKNGGNPNPLNEISFAELNQKIKGRAFGCSSDQELKLYIQNHQTELSYYRMNETCAPWADRMLYSLENSFVKHIDATLPISYLGRENQIGHYREQLKEMRALAPKLLSPELTKAIKPLLNICVHTITHHEVDYAKQLALEWNSDKGYSLKDEDSMVAFLKEVNYNSVRFFNYLVNKIKPLYVHEDCPRLQSKILLSLKVEYMAKEEETLGFALENHGIAKQMEEWIDSEIESCYRRMELHKLEPPKEGTSKPKIEMGWTVDEISCFFKKLRDTGQILNEREKDIHYALSETFRTQRAGNISATSIASKYYQNDVTVNESLIAKLLQVIKSLR